MLIVAIIGVIAGMSFPSMASLSNHYRAVESTRQVLLACAQARTLAQKRNEPVKLVLQSATQLVAQVPTYAAGSGANIILRTISSYADFRTFTIAGATLTSLDDAAGASRAPGSSGASVIFCPSGDGHFLDAGSQPVCGVGDLASQTTRLRFTASTEPFNIFIRSALGTVDLRSGS